MPELTSRIRSWFQGPPPELGKRQRAARDQLHGHIDATLLQGFIRKDLSPVQHAEIVEHLGRCHDCQEAIVVVLLSRDDPRAAAQIVLEREKRAKEAGPWWRTALRWTGITFALFALGFLAYILPSSTAPQSVFSKLLKSESTSQPSHAEESETSSGGWFMTTIASETRRDTARQAQGSPDWNSGAAPYVGKVDGMPSAIEVEIPPDKLDPKTNSPAPNTTPLPQQAPRAVTQNRLLVTNDGELMRTTDGGNTWKVIIIKDGLALRSLAVSGNTIWAVGDEGAIYRSPDAANNWQQVIVKYRGVPVTADIDQIRFTDEQHGEFQTADGDSWITVNGGNAWVLSYRRPANQ